MNSLDRIKKAHVAIMRHKKFCAYSGLLACGKMEVKPEVPTAYTDGWNVAYGDAFVQTLSDQELRFVVLHEATHKAYSHIRVWVHLFNENPRLANVAADHFVNLALVDTDAGEGFVAMPKIGIQPEAKYRGWSVQQIYDDLKKQGKGKGKGDGDGEGGFDEHGWGEGGEEGTDPAEAKRRGEEIKRAMRQGETLSKKMRGLGAGDADGVFGDVLTPKVDWRKVLRDFITELCSGRDESSWRRPNRRYLAEDIYLPSLQGLTLSELVIGFDTSGSCFGTAEMTRFVSEVTAMVEQVKPTKCHVIYWDTQVAGHQVFEDGQFAVQQLQPKGGGGTDGAVLFDYLREQRISPTAIVQLTDGYVGSWGTSEWPTLWAVTSPDKSAPFGTTIHVEV